jgi:hypothetical protein
VSGVRAHARGGCVKVGLIPSIEWAYIGVVFDGNSIRAAGGNIFKRRAVLCHMYRTELGTTGITL